MTPKVAVMDASRYDAALIAEKLAEALAALGSPLPHGARVLVKPNILAQNYPAQCATTHPAVIDAVCSLLADSGCAVTIGESSAFWQPGHTRRAFRTSGIAAIAKKYGAPLVAFEEDGGKLYRREENLVLRDVLLTRRLEEIDFLVNVPKLKTHSFFRMSGAVKNLFGLVPGGAKYEYHFVGDYTRESFGEKLCDIASLVPRGLTVMDAIWGLEGFGPAATGKPKETGLLIVSGNPFAVDCVAARVIGLDPFEVKSVSAGIKRGLIPANAMPLVVGDHSTVPSVPYRIPEEKEEEPRERDALYRVIAVRPFVKPARCARCGACVDACPFGAITLPSGGRGVGAVIDRERCLNCWLCHYRCPERAIALRGAWYSGALYALRRVFRI
jgi:uncharacterized protein (DUF362 family)/NAD-dependent dihydropyrimidine dehydrogenase PreA subunit